MEKTVLRSIPISLMFFLLGAASSCASGSPDSTDFFLSDSVRTDVNLFLETVKVVSALAITLVLLIIALWVFRKLIRSRNVSGVPGEAVQILEIHHIDPKKKIALVRVLDRVLIIGCADNSLASLGELSPEDIDRLNVGEHYDSGVFRTILTRFTGKGSKKSADS